MTTEREFLFHYRLDGKEWGIAVFAADIAEARERIKFIALVQYEDIAVVQYEDDASLKVLVPGDKWIDGWPSEKHKILRPRYE